MLSWQIETEMDLNSETNLKMGIYMGLQRIVSQSLKLETRRLASLCEPSAFYIDFGKKKDSGALCIGELFNSKGRHIAGVNNSSNYQNLKGLSKLFSLVAQDEIDDYSLAKLQNSRI